MEMSLAPPVAVREEEVKYSSPWEIPNPLSRDVSPLLLYVGELIAMRDHLGLDFSLVKCYITVPRRNVASVSEKCEISRIEDV